MSNSSDESSEGWQDVSSDEGDLEISDSEDEKEKKEKVKEKAKEKKTKRGKRKRGDADGEAEDEDEDDDGKSMASVAISTVGTDASQGTKKMSLLAQQKVCVILRLSTFRRPRRALS